MNDTLTTSLRFGWTTGTCATAATYAAYTAMVSGEFPQSVTIDTPSGKSAHLDIVTAALMPLAGQQVLSKMPVMIPMSHTVLRSG